MNESALQLLYLYLDAAEVISDVYLVPEDLFIKKINEFGNLKQGWYHGEGIPPTKETIDRAKDIAALANENLLIVDSAPGVEGEIQLALYEKIRDNDKFLEITIESNGPINITRYEKTDGYWRIVDEKDLADLIEVKSEIINFSRELPRWLNILEFSERNGITEILGGSQASPSNSIEEEYQLSASPAYQTQETRYAAI